MAAEVTAFQAAKALVDAGRWDQAEPALQQLLAQQPQAAAAHYLLALVLANTARLAEAAQAFARASQCEPGLVAAWLNQATALQQLGEHGQAAAVLEHAVGLHPRQPSLLLAAGRAAIRQERWAQAQTWLEQALSLGGPNADGLAHLGIALLEQGQHHPAIAALQQAVALDGSSLHARFHLALALKDGQQLEPALGQLEAVAAADPHYPGLHGNRAIVLFLLGRYREGWQEYAWRFQETPQILQLPPLPRWAPGAGRVGRLLVLAEQGLGDSFQFLRYLGPLAERAEQIRCVLQPALVPLVQRAFPAVEVLPGPWQEHHLEAVDAWLPLLSAAEHLEVSPSSPLVAEPYLMAPSAAIATWRERLGPPRGKRVALVWQGNPQAERGHQRGRSLPLQALEPLLDLPDLEWISLQRGPGAEQLDALGWRSRFHPLQAEIDPVWEFEHVAAILHSCDLLISTDTAITHLAGALGLPALLLLKWTPDWRWGLHGERCFWYPNHRLVRQQEGESWDHTVQRLLDQGLLHKPATV